jgi:hypothetical protein
LIERRKTPRVSPEDLHKLMDKTEEILESTRNLTEQLSALIEAAKSLTADNDESRLDGDQTGK